LTGLRRLGTPLFLFDLPCYGQTKEGLTMDTKKQVAVVVLTGVALVGGVESVHVSQVKAPDLVPSLLTGSSFRTEILFGRSDHGPETPADYVHTFQGIIAMQTTSS
jgi:hypothetical protein